MTGAVKAARGGTKPERGPGGDAKLETAGGGRISEGGQWQQNDGSMGAESGAPLTVTTYTYIYSGSS
jgi:hypothetical protein